MNRIHANKTKLPLEYYLNPDFVYINIPDSKAQEITPRKVLRNECLFEHNGRSYYSPISGIITGISDNERIYNRPVKAIVIANDFEENVSVKKSALKYINKYSKDECISLIKKYLPAIQINSDAKTLLINGIDKEWIEETASFIINNESDKILETLDALMTIFAIDNCIIAINSKNTDNVINITSNIGTYPNIHLKMLPDIYPIGFKNILIKNSLSKKEIQNGIFYLNVEDVLNLYKVLKKHQPVDEKYVTIGGNCIEFPMVVYTKIGVKIADLIKDKCTITNDKYYVILNGLISGITIDSLNSIVTMDTRSIFLNTIDNESEKECINCGLCTIKCPVHLNPKYIKEHKKADRDRCINCGLCSYICPSKINFKECLRRDEK